MAENAAKKGKSVGDPCAEYDSVKDLWLRCRAVINGEKYAKEFDGVVDTQAYRNLLMPFSPKMTDEQYRFYVAEAELPGIVSQFSKMITGGLLRKEPVIKFPDNFDKSIVDWLKYDFGEDGSSLVHFLDEALKEELQTSRAWVYVDYPAITAEQLDLMTPAEKDSLKPYPVLWKAEHVINWRVAKDGKGGVKLAQVITREYKERIKDNEFHPELVDTVTVHDLDESGFYRIRTFEPSAEESSVPVVNGSKITRTEKKSDFKLVNTNQNILINGERLNIIPAWPLSGQFAVAEPVLTALVDKEVALYNKISRRNHLLYSATTYTPVVSTDMSDEEFDELVDSGLGTWLRLRPGETATILETPTAALADMDKAIVGNIEEMAKLGIRMLTPEVSQSGVALDIRNAAQNAQLGTLNTRVSNTVRQVLAFMVKWRTGAEIVYSDIHFELSADLNPTPVGEGWLRLATEWYQSGLIPRSAWINMLKQNDMLSTDYDDTAALEEINADELVISPAEQFQQQMDMSYAQQTADTIAQQGSGNEKSKNGNVPPGK